MTHTTLSATYPLHIRRMEQAYEEALESTPYDAVLLHSGSLQKCLSVDDQHWPLKINPSFSAWVPLQTADTYVLYEKGKKVTIIRPIQNNFWEGPPEEPGDFWQASFNLLQCPPTEIAKHLPPNMAWIGESIEKAQTLGIAKNACNPKVLIDALDVLRSIKSEYEIYCIAEANRIAGIGHTHLETLFKNGDASELDLHLEYLRVTKQNATDTPYGNIVALGRNAAILHHLHYGRQRNSQECLSLLVDAGSQYMGYASDITRTYVRGNSQAAIHFGALIDALSAMELTLCKEAIIDTSYEQLHNLAHTKLAEILLATEICKGSSEELIEQGVTRAFFPHGLGHSIGLQVHDVGCRLTAPEANNPYLRNTSVIAEGQVVTIEPGCYFIDSFLNPLREGKASNLVAWRTVDALYEFGGIRIEDNLVIRAKGNQNLTRDSWPNP